LLSNGMHSRMEGSKTSPRMNGTGNVSEVDLKSSCPKSQNSMAPVSLGSYMIIMWHIPL
jgi:hypothetical protein